MSVLDKIIEHKKRRLEKDKKDKPLKLIKKNMNGLEKRDFKGSLSSANRGVIAEIKEASPTAGCLVSNFNFLQLIKDYKKGGASALSIVTEEDFFGGDLERISMAREHSNLPILRKDFIFDGYQIYESKSAGADAILLITKVLNSNELTNLLKLAIQLELDVLVEVHDREELDKALGCGAKVIGINNRNLKSMEVDISVSLSLVDCIPDGVVKVSESGIQTAEEANFLYEAGFDALLVGESLVKSNDPANKIKQLKEGKE